MGDVADVDINAIIVPAPQVLVIYNVLLSADLSCEIDLDLVCQKFGNAVYNPDEFKCTRIDARTKTGNVVSVSVFGNGKIQVAGGNSLIESHRAMKKVARKLKNLLQYKVVLNRAEVINILAVYDLGYPINLHKLPRLNRKFEFEPERFPGGRLKIPIPLGIGTDSASNPTNKPYHRKRNPTKETVTVHIFSTGKLTLVAARSVESLEYAIDKVKPYVERCKLNMHQIAS